MPRIWDTGHSSCHNQYQVKPVNNIPIKESKSGSPQVHYWPPLTHNTTLAESQYITSDMGTPDHAMSAWYPDTRVTHHFSPHVKSISSPQQYHELGVA